MGEGLETVSREIFLRDSLQRELPWAPQPLKGGRPPLHARTWCVCVCVCVACAARRAVAWMSMSGAWRCAPRV